MSDILDEDDMGGMGGGMEAMGRNTYEYSVSELSVELKRMIENNFPYVRIRGEIGRVSRPRSGHLYFDLKDDKAIISAITWKGQALKLRVKPEEGLEVIATGRITTFPGQSRYQIIVSDLSVAGIGALMLQLEKRKKLLADEGLFDRERKQKIPYLPQVIGVVTSPSGAVIRDILHRLRDRFPRKVLVWPVAVQGEKSACEVVSAIKGLNALSSESSDGEIPRPDVIIVARGGGSIEDLWGFNDEAVVRAVAQSNIPIISAVGHETDTTLIDYVSDQRAPTPTAAAEMAVPVRADIISLVLMLTQRQIRAVTSGLENRRQRLRDLLRALPNPMDVIDQQSQRLDMLQTRLIHAQKMIISQRRSNYQVTSSRLYSTRILDKIIQYKQYTNRLYCGIKPAVERNISTKTAHLNSLSRMCDNLNYHATLKRGYAVIRNPNQELIMSAKEAQQEHALTIEFSDDVVDVKTKD